MSAIEKLILARQLIEDILEHQILHIYINDDYKRLQIHLKDGIDIYIVYNNYNEYSYSVIFSKLFLDRCRFDNYDKMWKISSHPHHFHPRYKKEAIASEMTGIPEKDIPKLCKLLKTGKLG